MLRLPHVGEQLAIVYDEKLVSAPNLKEEISGGECWISGSFTSESAEQLASTVRIGALPLELENIHGNVVGATLGSQALKSSLFAGVVGLILVIIFMIVMYRISGVAASIALIFYVGACTEWFECNSDPARYCGYYPEYWYGGGCKLYYIYTYPRGIGNR